MKSPHLLLIGLLAPSICSASPQSMTDVQSTVQQRIGKRIEIKRDAAADEEIGRTVRAMLQGTMTADHAVQVALLNNRELQATFEDIGISDDVARVELTVGDAVLKLAAEVRVAFYTLQGKQMLFTRLGTLGETNAAALELSLRQHEAGNISDLELANQQSTYSQSKLEAAQVAAEMRSDREKLNRLMGVWGAQTEWKMADELPSLPDNFPTEGLEALAIAQRLDLAAAKAELGTIVHSLGKTYRLPVFNPGQGRIAKLKAQLRQAERRMEAAAIDIRSEVREARDRALAKKDLAAYYRDELVPERKRVLDLTLTSYNSMLKGPYDLLLARQNELAAERGYIDALRDYWIARADLERAVGGDFSFKKDPKSESRNSKK